MMRELSKPCQYLNPIFSDNIIACNSRMIMRHKLGGNLWVNSGDGVIHADGSGLKRATVSFDSIQRGVAGNLANYMVSANPDMNGMLDSTGIGTSPTPDPGKVVIWDSNGRLDNVITNNGDIITNSVTVTNNVAINTYPVNNTDAATVEYVNNAIHTVISGYNWIAPVINFVTTLVGIMPTTAGDRYIILPPGDPPNEYAYHIYQRDPTNTFWIDYYTPVNGDAVTSYTGPTSYIYIASIDPMRWIPIGFNGAHDDLVGKSQTNSVSGSPINTSGAGTFPIMAWVTASDRAWFGEVVLVGSCIGNTGRASFLWKVSLINVGGTLTFSISSFTESKFGVLSNASATLSVPASPNDSNLIISAVVANAVDAKWHATVETTYVTIPV